MTEQEQILKDIYKLEAKELYIPKSKEIVIAWLDARIDNLKKASKQIDTWFRDLNMGLFDTERGAYAQNIYTCGYCITPSELHIYSGIELLADALGAYLRFELLSDEYTKYSFKYRDVTVFELVRPDDVDKKSAITEYYNKNLFDEEDK